LAPDRMLHHHAVHHAQAHQQHLLELRGWTMQTGKVRTSL